VAWEETIGLSQSIVSLASTSPPARVRARTEQPRRKNRHCMRFPSKLAPAKLSPAPHNVEKGTEPVLFHWGPSAFTGDWGQGDRTIQFPPMSEISCPRGVLFASPIARSETNVRTTAWRTFMASNIPRDSDAVSLRIGQLLPCTIRDCARIQRLCHRWAARWPGRLG